MEIFPLIPDEIPAQPARDIGRVPAFDADRGFVVSDGALQERSGREAVQQWFDLMLRQQIDRVPIYRTGDIKIGIDRTILGTRLPNGMAAAEIERNVRETASYCPAVQMIRDCKVSRSGRCCEVEFTAVLYDGDRVEVHTDVR